MTLLGTVLGILAVLLVIAGIVKLFTGFLVFGLWCVGAALVVTVIANYLR